MTSRHPGLDALSDALAGPARAGLLGLARDAAGAALRGERGPRLAAYGLPPLRVFGAFVSLHEGNELRGCMGLVGVDKPVAEAVAGAAEAASCRDPRFERLSPERLEGTRVEVSILTPLEPLAASDLPDAIRVGEDGLVVSRGSNRGLLLPQVATEHGMDARAFLEATCRKASLPKDAWQEGALVERFSALVFSG